MRNSMTMIVWAAMLLSMSTRSVAGVVPIQPDIQEYPEWCWATAIVATLNGFAKYPGVDVEVDSVTGYKGQCVVAQKLAPGSDIDCCDDQDACFFGAYNGEISTVLNGYPYYMHTSHYTSTISSTELNNYINVWKLPVIASVEYLDGSWKHAVVVVALDSDLSRLTIMDPAEGFYKVLSMSQFLNGSSSRFPYKWIETTLWTKSGGWPIDIMSPNQKLLYSQVRSAPQSDPYMFYSQNQTTSGPKFTVNSGAKFGISSVNSQKITLKKGTTIKSGAKFCAKYGDNCTIP